MQSQEQLKQKKLTVKSQADDIEGEISEVRKRLTSQQKECSSVQKTITALEIKLEQKRADRHSLLKSCKVSYLLSFNFFRYYQQTVLLSVMEYFSLVSRPLICNRMVLSSDSFLFCFICSFSFSDNFYFLVLIWFNIVVKRLSTVF